MVLAVLLQSSSNQYLIIDKCSKIKASRGFPLGAFLRLNSSESVVSGAKTVPKISFYKNKFDKITYNSIVNNNIL